MRRGISLLEVLFAMFVLSMGLLSLAALIPVAKFRIREAENDDRAAACGVNALSAIEATGMLYPTWWSDASGVAPAGPFIGTFAIDPISVAANIASPPAFPFDTFGLQIPRYTVFPTDQFATGLPASNSQREQLARRWFVAEDDLTAVETIGDNDRPEPLGVGPDGQWGIAGVDDDGANGIDDAGEAATPGSDDFVAGNRGDYSWLFTVTPRMVAIDATASPPVAIATECTVQAAVFHKRDPVVPMAGEVTPPTERTVYVDIVGSGLGGGDVRLHRDDVGKDFLKLRPGQWVLLAGELVSPAVEMPSPWMRWYRVVSAGDPHDVSGQPAEDALDVSLAGPDITLADATGTAFFTDADSDPATGTTIYATIFTGLIGVYEKSMAVPQ